MEVLLVKCQESGCVRPATWKAGTWWFCAKHIDLYTIEFDDHLVSCFGTVYEHGVCKARDYWIGEVPLDMTVPV